MDWRRPDAVKKDHKQLSAGRLLENDNLAPQHRNPNGKSDRQNLGRMRHRAPDTRGVLQGL